MSGWEPDHGRVGIRSWPGGNLKSEGSVAGWESDHGRVGIRLWPGGNLQNAGRIVTERINKDWELFLLRVHIAFNQQILHPGHEPPTNSETRAA